MGTFIQQQRLAGGDAANIERVLFELVGERLLDVQNHAKNPRVIVPQAIQDVVDVRGVSHRAIKVGREPIDAVLDGNSTYLNHTIEIPGRVGPAQFDFEAGESVAPD